MPAARVSPFAAAATECERACCKCEGACWREDERLFPCLRPNLMVGVITQFSKSKRHQESNETVDETAPTTHSFILTFRWVEGFQFSVSITQCVHSCEAVKAQSLCSRRDEQQQLANSFSGGDYNANGSRDCQHVRHAWPDRVKFSAGLICLEVFRRPVLFGLLGLRSVVLRFCAASRGEADLENASATKDQILLLACASPALLDCGAPLPSLPSG